ncbi:hypothetical protein [Streptomyces spectabilis]|uniref:Uncharacterized protein n=1 Tax=Streptomyces spectabilis TaxID=68270 RepID=A0A5P2X2L1_STRST|nr:hypothetical protein [Streptomyces spectabilis]MBB5108394.1 hypothetical protein [Streptomyces spectabilis]MCI3901148.1 hypothetical protein [Streptomyces spectabilis]QEV58638.1 hypothetical protein CP982_07810 [Streptomyces spectabilis]GGV46254.1 hypothetical protein GCM10010245_72570 [Streptomyces spectabilis]
MVSSPNRLPEIVRQTPVVTDTKNLLVSTVRIGGGYYDTVIFDENSDKRHAGFFLGEYVINRSSKTAGSRDAAMDVHREALYTARTEEPFPPRDGHDALCAYASGMTSRCTCSAEGGARDE